MFVFCQGTLTAKVFLYTCGYSIKRKEGGGVRREKRTILQVMYLVSVTYTRTEKCVVLKCHFRREKTFCDRERFPVTYIKSEKQQQIWHKMQEFLFAINTIETPTKH